jgi:MFS family permease
MLGPGFVPISAQLGITIDILSQSTAWLILALGLCVFFMNPLAKIFGKRPIYVFASLIMIIVSIWGAAADNYDSFLASRIVGALGMAPYEVLVQATISDLYFVHERGTRIAVWNLFLLTGICGAGFVSGYIIEFLGYEWTFGICAILFGIFGIGIALFVPETTFIRPKTSTLATAMARFDGGAPDAKHEEKTTHAEHREDLGFLTGNGTEAAEAPHSYLRSLRIYTGRYTNSPTWKVFTRPFIMFFYPAVLFSFLLYGTTLTWIVVFSVVNGVLFTAPPYNFTVGEAGLTSLSPFILCIIGEAISGPLNDWICLKLADRNKGIYEPEYRLALMVVVVPLGVAGFYGFGATVHFQTHWSGPVLTYGLANMCLAFASTCVFGYVLDSYPRLAEEAFVAINTRNLLTFGLVSSVHICASRTRTDNFADVLCQFVACKGWGACCVQCSWFLFPCCLRACHTPLDLRQEGSLVDR